MVPAAAFTAVMRPPPFTCPRACGGHRLAACDRAAKAGWLMATKASTAALASGRKMMEWFIVVSQSCCNDVQVLVYPHSSDRKDRISEVCLRGAHSIALLWHH